MASWWSAKPDEDRKSFWAVTNGNKRWPASTHPLIFSLPLSLSLSSYFFPHCYEIKRFVRRRRRLRRRVTIREYLAPCQPAPIQSILASNNSTAHPRLLHFHFFFFFFFLSFSLDKIVPLCFEENRRFQKGIKIGQRLIFCRDSTKFESELINSEFRISGNFSVYDSSSLDLDHSVLDCSDRNKAQAKNTRRSSSISSFHPWYNICPRRLHCCRAMSMREVDYSKIMGRY